MKIDKIVPAIAVVVVIAYFFPQAAAPGSPVPIDTICSIGVSLIFFFYGLKLSPDKIKSGLRNWQLHLLIQTSTFILFPLIVICFYPWMQTEQQKLLWLGVFFLAALPSTVSSSVVMVSMAKGNIPASIFNASLSGIIGILITPLWMGIFVSGSQAGDFDFGHIYLKLVTEIIVPVALGIALQKYWGAFAQKHSSKLSTFDKSVILLIIYKSFAESFENRIFSTVEFNDLLLIVAVVIALFFLVYGLIGYISGLLRFNTEDKITAQFCGTKKSLVHGTVFSTVLFGNMAAVGIVLLPLMLFHAIQILLIGVIAGKLGKREEGLNP